MRTNEEGKPIWYKIDADKERQYQLLKQAVQELCEGIPARKRIKQPKHSDEDLLTLYPITDFHFGGLAWDKEGGDDWDSGPGYRPSAKRNP
jgi:hypothetical protein